ncbi:MAG: bifunctional diaminohydroxyphosphoribosylaminopyrimidine deaminase/5-amino-6-(5-phosphoribosylamino)uracil reductase RibD [Gammaproteobacteria bacterium]
MFAKAPASWSSEDHRYMAMALKLAERGFNTTHPNPRVGCVLVRDGAIVGQGWHRAAGEPHAEVLALREARDRARGASCYVSLEPCCHQGRTGPCSAVLIEAGITRVVAAMADPNPRVGGQGFKQLCAAGMSVEFGLMAREATEINRGFVHRMQRGRPLLRCKLGMSLDGRTALANGASRWITSPQARRDVQRWRARSSAVLTGIGSVLKDDPRLTVRELDEMPVLRQPWRVVLDSRLRIPATARLFNETARVIVMTTQTDTAGYRALEARGAEVIAMPNPGRRVDPVAALARLAELEINEVLVEAGPTLTGALISAGLVDELLLYIAPKLLGGEARPMAFLGEIERLAECPQLEIIDLRVLGKDLRLRARFARG